MAWKEPTTPSTSSAVTGPSALKAFWALNFLSSKQHTIAKDNDQEQTHTHTHTHTHPSTTEDVANEFRVTRKTAPGRSVLRKNGSKLRLRVGRLTVEAWGTLLERTEPLIAIFRFLDVQMCRTKLSMSASVHRSLSIDKGLEDWYFEYRGRSRLSSGFRTTTQLFNFEKAASL